jgi:hypothetical protein
MNCPECGTPVGADEKFCGNCGTPLQDSTADAESDPAGQDQLSDVQLPTDQDATAAEEEPTLDSTEQETIYSEPTQLAEGPMPLPAQDTYVPDPAGTADETIAPASAPADYTPAPAKDNKNKTMIIAIVVLVALLLCCCVAVLVAIFVFGAMEEGQSLYMILPSLTAVL